MGYTTSFTGYFKIKPTPNQKIQNLINGLSKTRRMKRDVNILKEHFPNTDFGTDGEFYFNEDDFKNFGQDDTLGVIDYNNPPSTQPSLWLDWELDKEDPSKLKWNESEKFYSYIDWLDYLIKNIFTPNNLQLNGTVKFYGDEPGDFGKISIRDNKIEVSYD